MVNELTGSPFLVSLVPVLFISPMLVFTLVGGELADRFPRTRVLAIGESIVFAGYVTMTVLVMTDVVQAWHVLVLTAVHGITAASYAPSRQSLLGDLVRPKLQRPALGLSPAIFNMAQIVGPLLGGLVLATLDAGAASLLGTALVVPAIPIFARLRPVQKSQTAHKGNFIQNIREGVSYISGHSSLRWYLIAGFALVITVNAWVALLPPLAKEVLGQGGGGLAALQVAVGIGALIGAVMSVPIGQRFGEKRLTVVAGFLFAGLVLSLAVSEVFLLSLLLAGLAAAVATLYFVTNMITMQLTASPEFRSRVISVRFIMFGFGPFGMIVLGLIAEFMGTQSALAASAISGAVLLLLIVVFMRTRDAAEVDKKSGLNTVPERHTVPPSTGSGPVDREKPQDTQTAQLQVEDKASSPDQKSSAA